MQKIKKSISNNDMKVVKGFFLMTNMLLIFATLGAYLVPIIPPKGMGLLPALGLFFPGLVIGNILFIIIWLLLKSKWAFASSLILMLGIFFAQSTLNFLQSTPPSNQQKPLQIGTYNMQFSKPVAFLTGKAQEQKEKALNKFLTKMDHLDILGVQECGWRTKEHIEASMNFPYQFFLPNIYTGIYSKYPIINKGAIDFGQAINRCLWADIAIGIDTIRFYTIHLASNQHEKNIDLVLNQEKKEPVDIWKLIGIVKYYEIFTKKRVEEATIIRQHQQASPYPCILSGDFNDPPQTHTYNLVSKGLKDTFLESGFGIGGTHGGAVPGLRIDYILVDPRFRVFNHRVFDVPFSDHFLVKAVVEYKGF